MNLSDVSVINLLPPNLARDKNVRMMCEAFDKEVRRIVAGIPGIAIVPNLVLKRITDNLFLDLLAWQFHCDFYSPDLPIKTKQELILKSLDWHTRKGTPSVVEETVSTVFSKAIIQEWYEYGGLPYRFRVATDEQIPDTAALNKLLRAIKSVKNTRSFLDSITQLVYFLDEVRTNELHRMTLRMKFTDDFPQAREHFLISVGNKYEERQLIRAFHDGTYLRDGTINHDGLGDRSMDETLQIWYKKHHFHDGTYLHDGTINHDSMILIPLE
jgi:phage tail P2-like protein